MLSFLGMDDYQSKAQGLFHMCNEYIRGYSLEQNISSHTHRGKMSGAGKHAWDFSLKDISIYRDGNLMERMVPTPGLIVGGIVWFKISSGGGSVEIQANTMSASGTEGVKIEDVPIKHVKDLKVVVNGETLTIAYREACPDKPLLDVLLLHGMAFKSQTWVSEPVFTVQQLYVGGYRAVAIDLPGFGDSPQASPDPAAFMEAVIQELKLNAPVIISPSMSGSYALPYLFNGKGEVTSRCRGYVPVAPVATEKYTPEQYKALKVPALVIYGENDKSIGPTSTKNLKNLPKRFMVELKGAEHACYMNKPVEFQTHLDTFLKSLL